MSFPKNSVCSAQDVGGGGGGGNAGFNLLKH